MARLLKVAVQMDPMDTVNIDADSTFALMLEAQSRGHTLWHYEVRHMALKEGVARPEGGKREDRLFARGHRVRVARRHGAHYEFDAMETIDLGGMDVVLMRQDPPFDMAYITATHMLEHIQPRTLVVNDPAAVRNAPEKILVTHFPDLMPPTLITWDVEAIRSFRREYKDIIVKPLFGNGGAGVFRIKPDDENLAALEFGERRLHVRQRADPIVDRLAADVVALPRQTAQALFTAAQILAQPVQLFQPLADLWEERVRLLAGVMFFKLMFHRQNDPDTKRPFTDG